jgi:branched-chain amino acid transport system ATP-binding protein
LADAALRLKGLNKSFGALAVTKDVSLDINALEVHAIIGPNGAGKSTLVAQIAGSLKSDAGRVLLAGRDVTHLSVSTRAALGIARVFQNSSLIGSFTVLENVALAAQAKAGHSFSFWRRASKGRKLYEQAQLALERVHLSNRSGVVANSLSHGEKRAAELAMALVQRPLLLLLDEPLAGVGRSETRVLTDLLAGLKGEVSILLVEHDMDAVFALADRITVLVGGAIAASGRPHEIRDDAAVRKAYLGEDRK